MIDRLRLGPEKFDVVGSRKIGRRELLKSRNLQSTAPPNRRLSRRMKQLSPTEWARMRDRITTFSLPDRGPLVRARWVEWLKARPGSGWFYPMADHIHFGAQADADAFRHRMMATAD